jgi:hypothetical protein
MKRGAWRSRRGLSSELICVYPTLGLANLAPRHLRILLELNSADDPAWTYFDAQHKFIMDQMNAGYRAAIANIKGTCGGD